MRYISYQNYYQKLLVWVLSAALVWSGFAVAGAQHKILAGGDPPVTASMINRLVNLFEWSLEVEFSAKDCAALQQTVVGYWKTNDAQAIQSVRDMPAFERKIQTWSDEQKRETQPQLKQKLLENFEQNPSDEMSGLFGKCFV